MACTQSAALTEVYLYYYLYYVCFVFSVFVVVVVACTTFYVLIRVCVLFVCL